VLLLLLFQEPTFPFWGWGQIAMTGGQTVILVIVVLWFLMKMAPTWKELKLREFTVREEEAKVGIEQANALEAIAKALTGLGSALSKSTDVLNMVVLEQRRATDSVRLLQRINAQTNERLEVTVRDLVDRLEVVEGRHEENPRTS